jgi:hypothetical protein
MIHLVRQCWSRWENRKVERCLRCEDSILTITDKAPGMRFYVCPKCERRYAKGKETGGRLVFRWLHPISVALYAVIFSPEPLTEVARVAELLLSESPQWQRVFVHEVELELRKPTQAIRDMHSGMLGSEQELRDFLRLVAGRLAAKPHNQAPGMPPVPRRPYWEV